ncbi:MAG: hypothetical protein EPO46_02870 [Lysobacter sp.]|nr:MAG: hypothetical protein EPO46_02870 [Lysobacter sp.]
MTNFKARALLIAGLLMLLTAVGGRALQPALMPDLARALLIGLGATLLLAGMLMTHLPDAIDASPPALRERYLREFMPPMVGYVFTILGSTWLLKQGVDDVALRALIALTPVPFIALAIRAIMRHIRDTDEMQRRIEVESVSLSTALVSLGYFAAGLLQAAKVIDVPASAAMIWMFPLICLVYGVAKVVIARRFS